MSDVPTQRLWRWSELSAALSPVLTDEPPDAGPDVSGVSVDSRTVKSGDLFIALPGDPGPRFNPGYRSNVDGHDYVGAAAGQGAVAALVHKQPPDIGDLPLLMVSDTYDGLWALGAAARKRRQGEVGAITGSSGKTTAKHFVSAALGAWAPPGSFNNHIGVPLSLANAPLGLPAVFEIGTNHPGEIEPLARMVAPTFAVLLNVHHAHIENFPSWSALREEKISIFKSLDDKSKAISEDIVELGYGLTFGLTARADARVINVRGDLAEIDFAGRRLQARVPGGGQHRALTVAAAVLVCHVTDTDLSAACDLPASLVPAGRGNIAEFGGVRVVDDSYNANPESMAASLRAFSTLPGRKIAVLGEMLELGSHAAAAHAELAGLLSDIDQVFCVGAGMQALAEVCPRALWCADADDALLGAVSAAAEQGSNVLVKGSNRVFWINDFVPRLAAALSRET